MRVFFVNDTTTSSNWGCRGTTRALRAMVEERAEITETLYLERMDDPRRLGEAVFEPASFPARLSKFAFQRAGLRDDALRALRAIPFSGRREAYKRYESLTGRWDDLPVAFSEYPAAADAVERGEIFEPERAAIEGSDVVLINGEGSIYDRQRKGRMMFFLAYLATERFDTPYLLVNHTADLHDPVTRDLAANVYPLCEDVVFREPYSARAAATHLDGPVEDHLGADAAFTYEPVADRERWAAVVGREGYFDVYPDSARGFDPAEPYVCVGGSSIFDRPDRPEYDPEPAYEELCSRLESEIAPVVLTASCESDAELFRPLAAREGYPLIGPHTPVRQAIDVLGQAEVYVSGRWHPSIYALTGGTPIVTLTANTYKTAGLVEHVGLNAPTFDALSLDGEVDGIVELASSYVEEGEDLRERLRGRSEELAERAERNVRSLEG
ncbi:MAG: polysaccharide pyruvyl transferase family protein [Halalkalicoccus sp.]